MAFDCPNCRAPVSLWRIQCTTSRGRFSCKDCGSILSIDMTRRFVATILWFGCFALFTFVLRFQQYGDFVLLSAYIVTFIPIYYSLDRIVLIRANTFHCRTCGYELDGLSESRCRESGQPFDPTRRLAILDRAGKPPPRRHPLRAIMALVVRMAALYIGFVAILSFVRSL